MQEWERNFPIWNSFIRIAWLPEFLEWAMCLLMIEKAQENIDEEKAKELEQKMRKNASLTSMMYLRVDESDEKDGWSCQSDGNDAGTRRCR